MSARRCAQPVAEPTAIAGKANSGATEVCEHMLHLPTDVEPAHDAIESVAKAGKYPKTSRWGGGGLPQPC
eukprot:4612783-Alexandrium_andersonii.AAC.1